MDDFKLIPGIGPAIERRLHHAGVTTYAQLAALSPEDVVSLTDNVGGLSAQRIIKQDWIGRANELASTTAIDTSDLDAKVLKDEEVGQTGVSTLAVGSRTSAEPLEDLRLDLGEVSFEEVSPKQHRAGEAAASLIRAEVSFRISGERAAQVVAEEPNYFVHILAEVMASDEMTVLAAMHGSLRPGVLTYTTALEFAPPEVGSYKLLGTIVISDYNAVGVTVGPKLTVVP